MPAAIHPPHFGSAEEAAAALRVDAARLGERAAAAEKLAEMAVGAKGEAERRAEALAVELQRLREELARLQVLLQLARTFIAPATPQCRHGMLE